MEKMRNIKLGQDGKGTGMFEGVRNTDMESWMEPRPPLLDSNSEKAFLSLFLLLPMRAVFYFKNQERPPSTLSLS